LYASASASYRFVPAGRIGRLEVVPWSGATNPAEASWNARIAAANGLPDPHRARLVLRFAHAAIVSCPAKTGVPVM
jgi:hypothetical protein